MFITKKFHDGMMPGDEDLQNGTFIFGAVLGVAGGILGGIGKRKQRRAEARAAEANAEIVRERTDMESTLSRRRATQAEGATQAGFGAAGVEQSGSVSDILQQTARDAAFELGSIQRAGELEEKALRMGAKSSRKAGNFALAGGVIRGVGSLFG